MMDSFTLFPYAVFLSPNFIADFYQLKSNIFHLRFYVCFLPCIAVFKS